MSRTEEEEAADIEAEAEFWRNHRGETECFGTVAKLVLLVMILVQSLTATT